MSPEAAARQLGTSISVTAVYEKIDTLLGLRYQPHQWSDLLRLLKPAARELGFSELDDFLASLVHGDQDERHADVLARHLTIGESYFFREIVVFSILREKILPDLIEKKEARGDRTLRIWSAGCSTGEEVYSIAILLESVIADRPDWQYEVLGTDVNPSAVQRAKDGVYRDWSFRDVPRELHAAYFARTEEGKHAVIDRIKENTEFRLLNLVNAPAMFPTGFDIIFCRNVLLYFTREKINAVVQGFRRALREDGWLIPSLTETTLINNPGFEGARFGDATLYRKQPHIPRLFPLRSSFAEGEHEEPSTAPTPSRGLRNPFTALFSSHGVELSGAESPIADHIPVHEFPQTAASDSAADDAATPSPEHTDQAQRPASTPAHGAAHGLVLEARRHADAGRLEEAFLTAREAISIDKMDPQAHYMLGTIHRVRGENSQALAEFERALYLHQDFIAAHFSIATLWHQLGANAKARRHFGIALNLIEAAGDMDMLLEPGDISARNMSEIIKTFLERRL